MNRVGRWWLRHTNSVITVCGVALVVASLWLPTWATICGALLAGAMIWNGLFLVTQRRRFELGLAILQREMHDTVNALNGERDGATLTLWVKPLDEDRYNVQSALKVGLEPFQIRRLVTLLKQYAGELDLLADKREGNRTGGHAGGGTPSPN